MSLGPAKAKKKKSVASNKGTYKMFSNQILLIKILLLHVRGNCHNYVYTHQILKICIKTPKTSGLTIKIAAY